MANHSLHGPLVFNDCLDKDFCDEEVKYLTTKYKVHFPNLIVRAAAASTESLNGVEQWKFSINFFKPEDQLSFGPAIATIKFFKGGISEVKGSDDQVRYEVFKMLPKPKINISI